VEVMGDGWRDKLIGVNREGGSRRRAHESFDALKTLRFVHALERTPRLRTRPGLEVLEAGPAATTDALERWCDGLRSAEMSFSREVGRARADVIFEPHRAQQVRAWMGSPGITDGAA
jgi:hypothetical protein